MNELELRKCKLLHLSSMFSNVDIDASSMAVFKEKSFAIFTSKGYIAIAGAEFGQVIKFYIK